MFFVPFLYTLKSRYSSISKTAVYFVTFIVPEILIYFLQNYHSDENPEKLILVFFLSFSSFVNIYEIGYIFNDTETIKKEKNPTLRLSENKLNFYESHKFIIYFSRFVLSAILNFIMHFFVSEKSFFLFCLLEISTLVVYFLYNKIRGRTTHFLYFLLITARYFSVEFSHFELLNLNMIIATLFIFPIVRTLEYKAHYGKDSNVNVFFRKYIIKYDVSKITVFRVWATLILLCVSFVLYFLKICNLIPAICCAYIFLYRLALFVAVKCGAKFKGYLKTDKEFSN